MSYKYMNCEALIDALMSYSWRDENDFSIDDAEEKRKYIEGWLPNIPAADMVEVVRCEECKYWNRDRISCEGFARCITGESGIRYRKSTDFCSIGVKVEEAK